MKLLKNPYIIIGLLLATAAAFYLYFRYVISLVMRSSDNKNVQAFLMMIRKCEGTAGPDGYRMTFGGYLFGDTSKHPNQKIPYGNTYSTAAGAYQFLYGTWTELALRLNLKDFSPESQDLGAIELIRQRNALADVEAGRFDVAVSKVRKMWASLPGAGYGQPEKQLATARKYYTDAGGVIAA